MARDDRKPRRRRGSGGLLDIVNGLFALMVLGILAAVGIFLFGVSQFYGAGSKAETSFFVEPGSSLSLIAERLETQGLVSNRMVFIAAGYIERKQRDLKPGEFLIPAKASAADILKLLTEGKPVEYFVTVPEGETSWAVAQRIGSDNNTLTGELSGIPAEGTIMPGRYDYFPRDTRQSVLDAMQAKMKEELQKVWESCVPRVCGPDGVVKSQAELVTLASIVERETGVPDERPKVASVFVNRLKKGMRLQSDPTIIYGITKGAEALGRGLKKSEIEAKTPYNTYQIDGLPAGPIANPGIEALRAVANPADTKDLYFVAAGAVPREGHLFAATYAEHRRNVALYRQAVKAAQAAAEAEADDAKQALEEQQAKAAGEDVAAP